MKTTYYLNLVLAFLVLIIGLLTVDIRVDSDYEGFSGGTYSRGGNYSGDSEIHPVVAGDSLESSLEHSKTTSVYQSSAFDYCLGSARLIGMSGMLKENIELTINGLRTEELPPLEMGMVNVTGDYAAYRMLPHGLLFNGDIRIILPYDTTLLPVGFSAEDIHTYYYNEQYGQWQEIERDSIDEENKLIVSRVNHFTDFINAVLKTPEMPETQAYTPTTMNDIKVANPLATLNLMSPPSPNNNGTANLNYPLEIPAGRQGMNPNLALSYNSSGGNGWMGIGWDISIPAITIDTRWGVPQYRSDKESEIYMMNGEQLATKDPVTGKYNPLPHRAAWVARDMSGAVRYYPRTEGAFQKIVRHGTSPQNYWWEVIDKTGMRYYYGKQLGTDSVDVTAVLRDENGNIAKWGLTEMRDRFDNFVYYRYEVSSLYEENKYFYIKEITYTGHDTTEGKYRIEFVKRNRITDLFFSDVTTNGRLGFLEVNDKLLTEVNIFYKDTIFRGYNFCYEEGAYRKTLLKYLSEKPREAIRDYTEEQMCFCSSSAKLNLYTHYFEYYEQPDTLFAPSEEISYTVSPLHFPSGLIAPMRFVPVPITGGNTSAGFSIGGALTLGLNDASLFAKSFTGGGNFNYSLGKSEGVGTLIDIDGDGFPDDVFKFFGSLYYRKQINSNGVHSFSQPFLLDGVKDFLEEKSKGPQWGLELNPVVSGIHGSIAYSQGKTQSSTFSYFSDVDGDGFPDIVNKGKVFYNRMRANGIRYFETFNSDTIWIGGGCGSRNDFIIQDEDVDPGVFQEGDTIINCYYRKAPGADTTATMVCDTLITESLDNYMPDHDAVRMWVAPYDGRVVLSGNAYLTADLDSIRKGMRILDGVKLSVQQNGIIIQAMIVMPDSVFLPIEDTLYVRRGDRFYFRMESLDKRLYDKIYWNPRLTYIGLGIDGPSVENYVDANGKSQYEYDAAGDFLVHQKQKIYMPYTGTIQIECEFEIKSALSTPVFMKLYQNDTLLDSLYFEEKQFFDDSLFVWSSVPVTKDDSVWFEISSIGNVAWEEIRCLPKMYYLSQTTITPPIDLFDTIMVPGVSTPIFEYKPSPYFLTFENVIYPTGTVSFTSSTNATLNPMLAFNGTVSGNLMLTIKSNTEGLELEQPITVNNNVVTPDSIQFTFAPGRTYFIDYYTEDLSFAEKIGTAAVLINNSMLMSGLHTHFPDSMYIFGALYRGWGQFTYTKDPSDHGKIDESVLHLSYPDSYTQVDTSSYAIVDTTTDIVAQMTADGVYDPLKDRFLRMYPDVYQNQWLGYGNITYVSYDTISNTFVSNNQVDETSSPIPVLSFGERIRAVHKISISKSKSISISFGFGVSYNWGSNQLYSDFIDMNGDRYPDIVSESFIQYTKPQGGLDVLRNNNPTFPYMDRSTFYNVGTTFGSSFIKDLKEIKNSAKNCRNSIEGGNIGNAIGNDESEYTYIDINGDGLPDKLNNTGGAFLNIGLGFHEVQKSYSVNCIRQSTTTAQNIGLSFNFSNSSIAGNFGENSSSNITSCLLTDINGDGLPDKVSKNGSDLLVTYNNGNSFGTNYSNSLINELAVSVSKSGSTGGTVSIGIPAWVLKVIINPQLSFNWGTSVNAAQLIDINADGYPDIVYSDLVDVSKIYVRYNQTGKTNLLKSVTNIANGSFNLDYALSENDYNCPQRTWTMSSLKIYDGHQGDGIDTLYYTYTYDSARYNRFDRESLGFGIVKTEQRNIVGHALYRVTTEKYHNTEYMRKGLKYYELIAGANGNKYIEKLYHYALKEIETGIEIPDSIAFCYGDGYPALNEEWVKYYEGGATAQIITRKKYDHGPYGNVKAYHNNGDLADPSDSLYAVIEYYTDTTDCYLVGIPISIATLYNNDTLRYRESEIDPLTGKLKQLRIYNNTVVSVYDYTYDIYGNTDTVRMPENYRHQRMVNVYEYDTTVHTYPVRVSNALGYVSEASYDYRFGTPLSTTDINGNTITYTYDWRGRLKMVKSPYDPDSSLVFDYWFSNELAGKPGQTVHVLWATTQHYDQQYPTNAMTTVLFTDALGREIQTKKDVEINSTEQHTVSGKVIYDAYGRAITTYYPVTESASVLYKTFNTSVDNITPTTTTYDLLDRQTSVTLPNGATTTMVYGFGNDAYAKKRFTTVTTDPLSNSVTVYKDVRGLQTTVSAPLSATTKFVYNRLGELTSTVNPDNLTTSYTYNHLGQQLSRTHPDAGTDTYTYDPAGNLLTHSTQVLANTNKKVYYYYNYNLLDSTVYPNNPENNVYYQYGTPSDTGNCTGRIKFMEDGSGWQKFSYGPLGEITENIRTFVLYCDTGGYTFKTQYLYDTWNRLKSMTYPDGEVVTYIYDKGGNLKAMYGIKNGVGHIYLLYMGYNKFEKKTQMNFGNGVYSKYVYDNLQRLDSLKTYKTSSVLFQKIAYTYDNANNITQIKNTAGVINNLGRNYTNTYTYDNLYRLISSTNLIGGKKILNPYTLTMAYTAGGKIFSKAQTATKTINGTTSTINYSLYYKYEVLGGSNKLCCLSTSLFGGSCNDFLWDANGNLLSRSTTGEYMVWDEENRMALGRNSSLGVLCLYDANGERAFKLSTSVVTTTVNGVTTTTNTHSATTLYVSPYCVVTSPGSYTKHYYAGSERICSKIGGGFPSGWLSRSLVSGSALSGKKTEQQKYLSDICEERDEFFVIPIRSRMNLSLLKSLNTPETLRYFYHPDHIGSTSWVTDSAKNGIQYCEYLPYGEPFLDQRSTTWNSRYTFSGKERDGETGYSYFGARYYNSDISIWLSVDPLSDKYPNLTPYAYCANNPIILVDPDGRAPWDPTNVKQARQYAKITGGYLQIRKTPNGKEATVTTAYVLKGWHGAEIRLFNPTNDSWGQKIGNFFRKIESFFTGGLYGTSENGQGQETRKGDGGNKQVDVSPYTSNRPAPIDYKHGNFGKGENSQENGNKEGTSGTIYIKEEVGSWNGGPSSWEYKGTEDSANKIKQFKEWEKEFNTKYIIKVEVNE